MKARLWVLAPALPALLGCSLLATAVPAPTGTVAPSPSPAITLPPGPTALPTAVVSSVSPTPPAPQPEAILITEPGPGSRLVSPLKLRGIVNMPVFEQMIAVRVVLDDGSVLIPARSVTVTGALGEKGSYAVSLPFTVAGERHAFIQVYDESARDGGTIHLASVGVVLAETGPTHLVSAPEHPEAIVILAPAVGAAVSGGVAHVEGFGLATFEQTLLVEVHDAVGAVVGSQPVIVQSPEWGQPGPFSVDVAYSVSAEGPGRIVVRDVSPAFGGDSHLASVEVTLRP